MLEYIGLKGESCANYNIWSLNQINIENETTFNFKKNERKNINDVLSVRLRTTYLAKTENFLLKLL